MLRKFQILLMDSTTSPRPFFLFRSRTTTLVGKQVDQNNVTASIDANRKKLSVMDLDLKSRTAVVTGASVGIGRAIAKALAKEGVRVLAVARRDDLLDKLAQEVRATGQGTVIPLAQDIMQPDAAQRLASRRDCRAGPCGHPGQQRGW